ncbi:MAG: metallophosphoesterase [Propionivibrio sp.]
MRLALYSDLHNECGVPWEPPESALQADVVVLAGDIGSHTHGLEWAARRFPKQPIVYVAGNHEYYDAQLGLMDEFQKPFWEQMDVHFLDHQSFELDGVRFLGCTLWSSFGLYGTDKAEAYMAVAKRRINDYWMIHARNGKRLEPRGTLKLCCAAVCWLEGELSKPFDGKTVVVTHFAPHPRCVAPQHQGSDVSPYFVTDLSWLMEKYRIDLWCYGRTHTNINFVAENGCRVVTNRRGYPGERCNGFNPRLMIEV